jgi:type II secretory pathway component PulF
VTKKNYYKTVIRARMEVTGEPYSVAAKATAQGLSIEIEGSAPTPTVEEVAPKNPADSRLRARKADFGELALFCERVAAFLTVHFTMPQAMEKAAKHAQDNVLQEGVEFMVAQVNAGVNPSDAMELRPNAFRGIFPELVKDYGRTPASMLAMATMYRNEDELQRRSGRLRN